MCVVLNFTYLLVILRQINKNLFVSETLRKLSDRTNGLSSVKCNSVNVIRSYFAFLASLQTHFNLNHRQTILTELVSKKNYSAFTRSVIPYIFCNLQRPTVGTF